MTAYTDYDEDVLMARSFYLLTLITGLLIMSFGLLQLVIRNNMTIAQPTILIAMDFSYAILTILIYMGRKKSNYLNSKRVVIIAQTLCMILTVFFLGLESGGLVGSCLLVVFVSAYSKVIYATIVSFVLTIVMFAMSIWSHVKIVQQGLINAPNAPSPYYWYLQSLSFVLFAILAIGIFSTVSGILRQRYVNIREHLKTIEAQRHQLEINSETDELTKLPNKLYFNNHIDGFEGAGFYAAINIASFKHLNTLFGMELCDRLLMEIGNQAALQIEPPHVFGRHESDTFYLWYVEESDLEVVKARIEGIRVAVNEGLQNWEFKQMIVVNWRIGVTHVTLPGPSAHEIMNQATMALSACRGSGPSNQELILFDQGLQADIERAYTIEHLLKQGCMDGEFQIVFQPKVDPLTLATRGVEALTRWKSQQLGWVSPAEFFPIMNKSTFFEMVTVHIIETTLAEYGRALKKIDPIMPLSINISPAFFALPNFEGVMEEMVLKYGIPYNLVVLEITEDVLIEDFEGILEKSQRLQAKGFKLSLDDFGTGYSSLKYLTSLAFNEIKIDKSFVDHIHVRPQSYLLLKSIIEIARVNGYEVVAEGAELKEQVDKLVELGCHTVQGYYFSKPLPLDDLILYEWQKDM